MDITYEHISIGITVTACIFAVVGGLIGLARGGKRAAIHIATAAAAFAAAVFLTVPFVTLTSGITRRLSAMISQGDTTSEIAEDIPTLAKLLETVSTALIAPLRFVSLFIMLLIFFSVATAIVIWAVKRSRKRAAEKSGNAEVAADNSGEGESRAASNLCGFLCGTVRGLIIVSAICIPIVGYIGLVSDAFAAADAYAAEIAVEDGEVLPDGYSDVRDGYFHFAAPLSDSGFCGVLSQCGGKAVFDRITTVSVGGEKYALCAEVPMLARTAIDIIPFVNISPEGYGESQSRAIDRLTSAFSNNGIIKNVIADALHSMAAKWTSGGEFLGTARPKLDPSVAPVFDRFLGTVADITPADLDVEIKTVGELAKLMISCRDILSGDEGDIASKILESGVISRFVDIVKDSRLFAPLAEYAVNSGISYLGGEFGITGDTTENGNELAGALAERVSDALSAEPGDDAEAKLAEGIKSVAAEHGINIPDEALPFISEYLLEQFEGRESVSAEDIISLFMSAGAGAEDSRDLPGERTFSY